MSDPDDDEHTLTPEEDAALFAELERRRVKHESGHDPGIDGEEFFRRLREGCSTSSEEKR